MKEVVNSFVSSTQGMLTARTKGIQTTIKGLQKSAERIEARVAASEATLRAQFNALETLLAKYQATETYLGQQINSLNNLNSYISNK
jgi:flagellar hook-associated protein 2